MMLESGSHLRITFRHDEDDMACEEDDDYFVVLHDDVSWESRQEAVNPEQNKFYFYLFDPLTSKTQEGLGVAYLWQILSIKRIPSLPVSDDYVVHSTDEMMTDLLAGVPLCNEGEVGEEDARQFADDFMQTMTGWLTGHVPPLVHVSSVSKDKIRKSELTDLGLDFMRQHYRKIWMTAVETKTLPLLSRLNELAADVAENRTTDADWV